MARFIQTLQNHHYNLLVKEAQKKYPGVGSVQKFIRYDVVPDWIKRHFPEIYEQMQKSQGKKS